MFVFFRILYIYSTGGTTFFTPPDTRGVLRLHGEMQRDICTAFFIHLKDYIRATVKPNLLIVVRISESEAIPESRIKASCSTAKQD